MTNIVGTIAPGWEPVREAFAANLANTEEVGAGVSAYYRGVQVVDLWGGWFDAERTIPYAEHSLQLVFSTTKGITAIAVAMCVDRGLLSYDAPVSKYWPEFAAHGKGDATVAQLLSHQVGLYTVDGPISLEGRSIGRRLQRVWLTQHLVGRSVQRMVTTRSPTVGSLANWCAESIRNIAVSVRSFVRK